jgi:hypothetical protein
MTRLAGAEPSCSPATKLAEFVLRADKPNFPAIIIYIIKQHIGFLLQLYLAIAVNIAVFAAAAK